MQLTMKGCSFDGSQPVNLFDLAVSESVKAALWGSVIWWILRPMHRRVANWVWLCGGLKVRSHWCPSALGIGLAEDVGWCCRCCDRCRGYWHRCRGCLIKCHRRHDWYRRHKHWWCRGK